MVNCFVSNEISYHERYVHIKDIRIRDPFVFVEDGKYYLLGTTGEDLWGKGSDMTLYVSEDLVYFEKKCTMVDPALLESYKCIWAPELHKYNGEYYLFLTLHRDDIGRGTMIFVSDHLDSNFKMLSGKFITPDGWECIDATMIVHENIPYLSFSNGWWGPVSEKCDGSLFMGKLSDDLTHLVEEPHQIVSGKRTPGAIAIGDEVKGYIAEGPWVYEDNGKIVVLWSGHTKNGYAIFKNVSSTGIYGEFVYEKTLFDRNGGHCMRFTDLNGMHWVTLHRPNTSPDERMALLSVDE